MDLGAERREKTQHLQILIPRLAVRQDIKLLLFCRADSTLSGLAGEHGLEAINCKNARAGGLFARLRLGWRLRKPGEPWLMQCFDQESLGLAMRVAAKKNHLNIIYSMLRPESIIDKKITENLHLVGAVAAATEQIAESVVSQGFQRSSVFVFPGCIDASAYPARRPHGEGRVIFACSDTLEEDRGYDQLLQGMAALYRHENMPPWELRIAGGGPMFETFLEKAKELNVDSRLAIFGGFNGPDILRDCDVMIAPANRDDGSSLSIKEAWAAGLALICSDLASHREMVTDGKNGLLFQNGNPVDLAAKMYKLSTDPDLRAALEKAGRASLAGYTCENMLQKHLELYQNMLGQPAGLDYLNT